MSGRIEDRLKALRDLPDREPPARLEQATLEAMAQESLRRFRRPYARAAAFTAAVGAGALLAIFALDFDPSNETPDPITVPDTVYRELLAESVRLERLLVELPPPRRVMRVSTAGTIVGLEERIALIDAELGRAGDGVPEFRTALMRDRVEAMNALVNVRYAQSRAFTF